MSGKEPENKDGLLEIIKKLWLPVAGFLGAVTLAYNFYQLWLGDQKTVTWFLAGGGMIVLVVVLYWVGFSKVTTEIPSPFRQGHVLIDTKSRFGVQQQKWAKIGLGVIGVVMVAGVIALVVHTQSQQRYLAEREQMLIVLIAQFEGPEEVYGLRNEILEKLNAEFSGEKNIEIIPFSQVITLDQGSDYARKIGEESLADVVIWGWYRPTDNPNITIHIENLAPEQLFPLDESGVLQPRVSLAELKSFSFQQQAAKETSALISFLAGFIDYRNEEYALSTECVNDLRQLYFRI